MLPSRVEPFLHIGMTAQAPNIINVICHDLGQHLGCYGVKEARTPTIDAFARDGILFKKSFCTAPQCSPSRAALWTGRFPHANGVVGLTHGYFANDLNPDEVHFTRFAADAGYETHLFGTQHETPRPQERLSFQHYHQQKDAIAMAGDFVEMIKNRGETDQPLYASFGTFEPHRPFPHERVDALPHDQMTVPPFLPDIPVVREDLAAFEASAAAVDVAFGMMLEAIRNSPLAGNTIIIFTADHGMPFVRAKMSLYDKGLEVPLIIQGPGMPQGIVNETDMISNVDILPTLLELMGHPLPDNLHGRSFAGLLTGGKYTPNDSVFGEMTYHTNYDPVRCVRTHKWKLIASFDSAPRQMMAPDFNNNGKGYPETCLALELDGFHPPYELFDLEADPYELNNLADDPAHAETRDGLIRQLRDWMERTGDPLLDGPIPQAAYIQRMAAFKEV